MNTVHGSTIMDLFSNNISQTNVQKSAGMFEINSQSADFSQILDFVNQAFDDLSSKVINNDQIQADAQIQADPQIQANTQIPVAANNDIRDLSSLQKTAGSRLSMQTDFLFSQNITPADLENLQKELSKIADIIQNNTLGNLILPDASITTGNNSSEALQSNLIIENEAVIKINNNNLNLNTNKNTIEIIPNDKISSLDDSIMGSNDLPKQDLPKIIDSKLLDPKLLENIQQLLNLLDVANNNNNNSNNIISKNSIGEITNTANLISDKVIVDMPITPSLKSETAELVTEGKMPSPLGTSEVERTIGNASNPLSDTNRAVVSEGKIQADNNIENTLKPEGKKQLFTNDASAKLLNNIMQSLTVIAADISNISKLGDVLNNSEIQIPERAELLNTLVEAKTILNDLSDDIRLPEQKNEISNVEQIIAQIEAIISNIASIKDGIGIANNIDDAEIGNTIENDTSEIIISNDISQENTNPVGNIGKENLIDAKNSIDTTNITNTTKETAPNPVNDPNKKEIDATPNLSKAESSDTIGNLSSISSLSSSISESTSASEIIEDENSDEINKVAEKLEQPAESKNIEGKILKVHTRILKEIIADLKTISKEINAKDLQVISTNTQSQQLGTMDLESLKEIKAKLDEILPEIKKLAPQGFIIIDNNNKSDNNNSNNLTTNFTPEITDAPAPQSSANKDIISNDIASKTIKDSPVETKQEQPISDRKDTVLEAKQEQPKSERKETVLEAKQEQPKSERKETVIEAKQERPISERKETILEAKQERPISERKETVIEAKQERPISERKDTVIEVKQERPIIERKETVIEAKQERPIIERKETVIEVKQERPISERKETVIEVKQERPISERKETVLEVKQELPISEKQATQSDGTQSIPKSGIDFSANIDQSSKTSEDKKYTPERSLAVDKNNTDSNNTDSNNTDIKNAEIKNTESKIEVNLNKLSQISSKIEKLINTIAPQEKPEIIFNKAEFPQSIDLQKSITENLPKQEIQIKPLADPKPTSEIMSELTQIAANVSSMNIMNQKPNNNINNKVEISKTTDKAEAISTAGNTTGANGVLPAMPNTNPQDAESRDNSKSRNSYDFLHSRNIGTMAENESGKVSNDSTNSFIKPYSIRINDIPRYVSRIVTNLQNNTTHTATLNLSPASLGKISIEISINGNLADLKFKVEGKDTAKSVESQMVQLKESLAKSGIKIESVGVEQNNINSSADKHAGHQHGSQGENSRFGKQQTHKEYLNMINFSNKMNKGDEMQGEDINNPAAYVQFKKRSLEQYI